MKIQKYIDYYSRKITEDNGWYLIYNWDKFKYIFKHVDVFLAIFSFVITFSLKDIIVNEALKYSNIWHLFLNNYSNFNYAICNNTYS